MRSSRVALAAGVLFALPNLFGEDPAVQVSAVRGAVIDEALRDRLLGRIEVAGITALESEIESEVTDRLLIRFESGEDQLEAQDIIEDAPRPPVRRRAQPRARDPGLAGRPGRAADVSGP